jgi:hypothetical protein
MPGVCTTKNENSLLPPFRPPQIIPQHVEVPLNIEAGEIRASCSNVPAYYSNKLVIKEKIKDYGFPSAVGRPLAMI